MSDIEAELERQADEIERLRGRLREYQMTEGIGALAHMQAEIERLRERVNVAESDLAGSETEIERLQVDRDQFAEQAAMRDNRDADMQEIMRINNELKVENERLIEVLQECQSRAFQQRHELNSEIERLRADLDYVRKSKDEARAEIERLRALMKRHDDCWRLLHEREYTGALRDDTRAALGGYPSEPLE